MRLHISRVLSFSGLSLGVVAWLVLLVGLLYATLALSAECPPNALFPPRDSATMLVSNVAWWFSLGGLPLGVAAVGVNFRNRLGWGAVALNAAFWVLLWGGMYGDVATCAQR